MTAVELRAILARAGLSQLQAAKVLCVDPRTVRRWVSGDAEIPPPVAKLLYLASRGFISWQSIADA